MFRKLSRLACELPRVRMKFFQLKRSLSPLKRTLVTSAVLCATPVVLETFEPNDPRLKTPECLKNAAGMAVDSSSAVLSQTVYAIFRIEEEYKDLMDLMVKLIEYQLQVVGHKAEEERMADIILETRLEIDKVKRRKQDLELLFASAEKLADATAEVAFATGMEFASTSMGERLYNTQREVKRVQEKTEELEQRLQQVQLKVIEVMGQLEEKEKKKQKQSLSEGGEVLGDAGSDAGVEEGEEEREDEDGLLEEGNV
ncbi:uncharacterized protein LOC101845360 [Aplysia californica]|uniref:Direct IAP-binding protein with low pI n=1 Tax=Aplysia californica TaxID=6500 RepID=A0ABM0K707_APLCA|nr:uncharacterized protein LOC101845360 [Aplysia californica]